MKEAAEYHVQVTSRQKKCFLCLSPHVGPADLLFREEKNGTTFTEMGKMLLVLLSMNEKILSQYCCLSCADKVVACFDAILDLNVAALRACQMAGHGPGGQVPSMYCEECSSDLPNEADLARHLKHHVLDIPLDLAEDNYSPLTTAELPEDTWQEQQDAEITWNSTYQTNSQTETKNGQHKEAEMMGGKRTQKGEDVMNQQIGSSQCDVCGMAFKALDNLKVHWQMHKTPCSVCGKLINVKHMQNHLLTHGTPSIPEGCIAVNPKLLRLTATLDISPLVCSHCGKSFSDREMLRNHKVLYHGEHYKNLSGHGGTLRGKECNLCGLLLCSDKELRIDKRHEHGDTAFVNCETCAARFHVRSELAYHLARHVQAGSVTMDKTVILDWKVEGNTEADIVYLKDLKMNVVSELLASKGRLMTTRIRK